MHYSINSSACQIRSMCALCSRRRDLGNPIGPRATNTALPLSNIVLVKGTYCVMTHATPVPKPYSPSFTSPKTEPASFAGKTLRAVFVEHATRQSGSQHG